MVAQAVLVVSMAGALGVVGVRSLWHSHVLVRESERLPLGTSRAELLRRLGQPIFEKGTCPSSAEVFVYTTSWAQAVFVAVTADGVACVRMGAS